jgi:hypothetical protein
VHLESDRFFHFIVSGYIKPWKPESHGQNTIVMRIVGEVAASYANAGYFTVIDGIVSPRWFFPPLRNSLSGTGLELAYAILRPSLPIAVERATRRESTDLRDPDVIEQLWEAFADVGDLERHVFDNSHESIHRTTVKVDEAMQRGALTV